MSTEYGEVSPNAGLRLAAQSPKNGDHFLRSPCPLLVESSFARMAGSKTGLPRPPKPRAAVPQSSEPGWEMGKPAMEACTAHHRQPLLMPRGSQVSSLRTRLRNRPCPPSGQLTFARPPPTHTLSLPGQLPGNLQDLHRSCLHVDATLSPTCRVTLCHSTTAPPHPSRIALVTCITGITVSFPRPEGP